MDKKYPPRPAWEIRFWMAHWQAEVDERLNRLDELQEELDAVENKG